MTEPDLLAPTDGESILANARAIRPLLAAAGAEIDAAGRLPAHVVTLLKRSGAYRMAYPRSWGGPEVDPMMQIRIISELCAGNGSAGWCAMIGSDGGFFCAFLEQDAAHRMWVDVDAPTATTAFPAGKAIAVDGGYRVTGRWPYASGSVDCAWMGGSCEIIENGELRMMANGQPETLILFVPQAEATILETWDTTGMRGSSSHDWSVTDYFVPSERAMPGLGRGKAYIEGALYASPLLYLVNHAGVPLGLAHGAVDTALEILKSKKTVGTIPTAGQPHVRGAMGHALARLGAVEAYVFATVSRLWETFCAGDRATPRQIQEWRLATVHAHKECQVVVDTMYEICGGAALYLPNAMDRYMRDLRTANQHVAASQAMYYDFGKAVMEA